MVGQKRPADKCMSSQKRLCHNTCVCHQTANCKQRNGPDSHADRQTDRNTNKGGVDRQANTLAGRYVDRQTDLASHT